MLGESGYMTKRGKTTNQITIVMWVSVPGGGQGSKAKNVWLKHVDAFSSTSISVSIMQ